MSNDLKDLPKNFAKCEECGEVIRPDHMMVLLGTILCFPDHTIGPYDIEHYCPAHSGMTGENGDPRYSTILKAELPIFDGLPVVSKMTLNTSANPTDSELLLRKYIKHVSYCEGIDFITDDDGDNTTGIFTDEEWDKLTTIAIDVKEEQ